MIVRIVWTENVLDIGLLLLLSSLDIEGLNGDLLIETQDGLLEEHCREALGHRDSLADQREQNLSEHFELFLGRQIRGHDGLDFFLGKEDRSVDFELIENLIEEVLLSSKMQIGKRQLLESLLHVRLVSLDLYRV